MSYRPARLPEPPFLLESIPYAWVCIIHCFVRDKLYLRVLQIFFRKKSNFFPLSFFYRRGQFLFVFFFIIAKITISLCLSDKKRVEAAAI